MSKLVEIYGCKSSDRKMDVVLIHGLDGHPIQTWRVKHEIEGEEPEWGYFWPLWLGNDFPETAIWSLGYEASSSSWRGHSMPLLDRAANLLEVLDARGIGHRPLVLVAHSLGGLLAKQLIREARDRQPAYALGSNTIGIVFFATPHTGSSFADIADALRVVYGTKELAKE